MFKYIKLLIISFFALVVLNCNSNCEVNSSGTMAEAAESISRREMQSVVQFFSDDLFEGRAPGTRGGELAEKYVRGMLKFMDIESLGKSYFQPFKLFGFATKDLILECSGTKLNYPEDIVGTYTGGSDNFEIEGDGVFIGFGIKTDLWDWDDYKDYDIDGKFVIARVNDPGMFLEDIFEGKVLTYFGRWKYHIEEAQRRGASGILLIHTDESAGYGWNVIQNSWGGEDLYIESGLKGNMKFRAWIKESSLKTILAKNGFSLEDLYARSLKRNFSPVSLGVKFKVTGEGKHREVMNNNVIGFIKGKTNKSIVLSAHIDHLGMDTSKAGDNIYNGALDNGTAVTSMLLTAKILKRFEKNLYYSIIILAPNAEESGLLGTKYFVENFDRSRIIANINFESTPVWGKAGSIMGVGARFSTMENILKQLTEKDGLKYSYFSMSNQGFYFRSDQFPFAAANIPSIWISAGEDDNSGKNLYKKFWSEKYHTVKDEYDPGWDLGGLKQTIKFALLLIDHMDKNRVEPEWNRKLTFPVYSR
ncbi:MAG: M28 family peptidase [Acidobacteriota bacterium]